MPKLRKEFVCVNNDLSQAIAIRHFRETSEGGSMFAEQMLPAKLRSMVIERRIPRFRSLPEFERLTVAVV